MAANNPTRAPCSTRCCTNSSVIIAAEKHPTIAPIMLPINGNGMLSRNMPRTPPIIPATAAFREPPPFRAASTDNPSSTISPSTANPASTASHVTPIPSHPVHQEKPTAAPRITHVPENRTTVSSTPATQASATNTRMTTSHTASLHTNGHAYGPA
jgi:hypothetical protein